MADGECSFTERAICEAVGITRKNQCCRRAFMFGVLLGGGTAAEDDIKIKVKTAELAEYTERTVKEQFGREAVLRCKSEKTKTYELTFFSQQAARMINSPDEEYEKILKCQGCLSSLLCGIFCSCASVNDPKKDYYLSIRTDVRCKDTVSRALAEADIRASYRTMGKKCVFYMRASERIEELFAVCGMQKLLFDFMNCKIEKDIRNNANRMSNFEYKNIQKSVGAAQKYIEAIVWLQDNDRLTGLDFELSEAARLRVEYPDCSLSALGAMMTPAVSKSGVVHRLNRIYAIYQDAQKTQNKKD